MKTTIIILVMLLPISAWAGCYSDFDCGIGYACIKALSKKLLLTSKTNHKGYTNTKSASQTNPLRGNWR